MKEIERDEGGVRDRGGERDGKEGERDTRVEGDDYVVVDSVVNRSNKGGRWWCLLPGERERCKRERLSRERRDVERDDRERDFRWW